MSCLCIEQKTLQNKNSLVNVTCQEVSFNACLTWQQLENANRENEKAAKVQFIIRSWYTNAFHKTIITSPDRHFRG
jgi:hypothetical protein